MNPQHSLLKEFPPVSTREWEDLIKKDLNGKDYKKTLLWKTGEGIEALPFYRKEDLKGSFPPLSIPDNDWEIRQSIMEPDVLKANKIAREAIEGGADALSFDLHLAIKPKSSGGLKGVNVQNQKAFNKLLKGIDPQRIGLHFDAGPASPALLAMMANKWEGQTHGLSKVNGTLCFDPFKSMLLAGRVMMDRPALFNEARQLASFCDANIHNLKSLAADGRIYHNSGGTIVQELGFSLAAANEYLAGLSEAGLAVETIASAIHFNLAIGANYFLEIAKFRALRKLWSNILKAYKLNDGVPAYIHASTSLWNKTLWEPYVNMLRATTEGMSAACAGCDAITIHPFDETFRQPNDFSRRMARNSQLILKEEAYFNKVADPAAGSYYVEALTDKIAEAAWNCFQKVEEQGGLFQAICNEYVQAEIEKSRQKRDEAIATRNRIFVGTNQYPNTEETTKSKENKSSPLPLQKTGQELELNTNELIKSVQKAIKNGCTLGDILPLLINFKGDEITPLQPYRGAAAFEELRKATEEHKTTPKVLILPLGDKRMRKARSAFAANFFGCAGYDIENPSGFESVDRAVAEIKRNGPDVIVLCSSDEEYETLVPALCKRLDELERCPITVLAGYPREQIERYTKEGIDEFIHGQCNVLRTLKHFQKRLSII